MAETVKKSRIVSEDDLEESVMQEFNMRLKTCMSNDKLNEELKEVEEKEKLVQEEEDEERTERTAVVVEEVIKENGNVEGKQLSMRSKLDSMEEFLKLERECLMHEQQDCRPINEETVNSVVEEELQDAVEEQQQKSIVMEEVLPEEEEKKEQSPVEIELQIHEEISAQEEVENIAELKEADEKEDAAEICESEIEERVEHQQQQTEVLMTNIVETLEMSEQQIETRSVKDRMFLSTDSTSCLLFSQTVTSPMLTPSEERVDFIKGFQRDSPPDTTTNESPASEEPEPEEEIEVEEDEQSNGDTPIQQVDLLKDVPNGHEADVLSPSDTITLPELPSVKSLTNQYIMTAATSNTINTDTEKTDTEKAEVLKSLDIMKQISKFEQISPGNEETKSSFSKFDALQKKNVLHVRSTDSSKAQEKFNGNQIDSSNCKSCGKIVFQMEQMKAEKCIWHKNCFRCAECNKQLTVDTYQSHEGTLYCKPHFRALFAPKAVEEDAPQRPRKHEMIIRENQPQELPPDVVRASDKPDLGLEELQSLNVKERFQVFEHHQQHEDELNQLERTSSAVNVKRSPSILSKLARFQAKGMDIGVADDSLNGIPIEESSSEEEEEQEELEGEDADLIRAKKAQKEKPFHFVGMSDVKSKWEQGDQNGRDERREERKQEIQSIRNRLFMGKQGKMKEAYQQAVMDSEMGANVKKTETIEVTDTRSLKERFEKGQLQSADSKDKQDGEDMSVFESGISKKSRSIFLELDANASKAPQLSPLSPTKSNERKGREVFLQRETSEEVVKSTEAVEDVTVQTADIQQRFKFFETYREPEQQRKQFRITPPRDGQVKIDSPDREVYRDPDVVRSEEQVEDSVVAKQTQTAKKMLNKFRQMEEDLSKDQVPLGPKPLKRFTPPPEPIRSESESEDVSGSEEESDEEEDDVDNGGKVADEDLLEAQKAARAKQLRAKFEKWEANEIKREQNMSSINLAEELGEEQSQVESTKSLRARFESMRDTSKDESKAPRVKVNRFVVSFQKAYHLPIYP
ncbi:PREDICTED: myosin-9 isoform X1 [Nicrophorus vespilloides]|uniref:Myosin-9 isoform X1 n=1 Tax=Nicrophorus vespilloides TaxID=110193 RepID=A0ABM1MIX5_NICVS|nr:PREDICTED: myosin-9 isoform X1 [Nicrophorus vespilloides]